MMTFFSGFFVGLSHVLAGPDHLAAVIPFSLNMRQKAWLIGLSWGTGHTLGALLIGLIFLLFREVIPVEKISAHSETIIGIMLILIGIWAFWRIFFHPHHSRHAHPHYHENPEPHIHTHGHDHTDPFIHIHEHPAVRTQTLLTTAGIGILHGLAGFSHLLAVMPSFVLPGRAGSYIYLAAFGTGTILTMIAFTAFLGYFTHRLEQKRRMKLIRGLSITGASISVLIGVIWIVSPF